MSINHACNDFCRKLIAEATSGGQRILWNSLTHLEQAAWGDLKHERTFLSRWWAWGRDLIWHREE